MNTNHSLPRRLAAALSAGALALGGLAAQPAAADVPVASTTVDLVDATATEQTRSLFSYLRDVRGQGILFGHQHTTDYGESFGVRDGVASDVLAATGDYPAVWGFDTLIIEGRERPGDPEATREQNALTLAQSFREAHDLGGISTLSAHIENFVTGNDFYDTSGDALRAVLPGGARHQDLVEYLDLVALAVDNAVDADGNHIPVIFRPWHENAGSWFWWGAAFGSPGEYKELFRFTVEYLRDVKEVHNLLYAFSPGGGFGGSAEQYLRTYPGDDYVDVLGFDTYDAAASPAFLQGLVADLGMIADEADARGKISAFTEFGITGGVQPDGANANTTWYTDVLEALKADPSASRTAYMATWANFGDDTTPYTPLEGELLPDFLDYHSDPFTLFAADLDGVFSRTTDAVAAAPTAHLASPADGARVATDTTTLRASVAGYPDADAVQVAVGGSDEVIDLTAPAAGELWWTSAWELPEQLLDNSTHTLRLRVLDGDVELAAVDSAAILGQRPVLPAGVVDDFEGYGDDTALRSEYVQYNSNTISLETGSVGDGEQALRFAYSFAAQDYTGVGKQLTADWSGFGDFEVWVHPDGSSNKLVLQLQAGGVSFEAYPSLAGDEPGLVTIPFADWRPAPWDTGNADARLTAARLAKVTQFNIYVNAVEGGATDGVVRLDSLRAVPGSELPEEPEQPPVGDEVVLADFTDGAQGWDVASWETNGGTAVAEDGRLHVQAGPDGNWVGVGAAADLTGFTRILVHLPETTGTDSKVALQLGPDWTWCETGLTGWHDGPADGADALAVDLTTLSESCLALLGDVRGLYVYLSEGSHQVEEVRAGRDVAEPSPSPSPSDSPSVSPSVSPEPSVSPSAPVAGVGDLYSTPGFHVVNGRHWHTTCEPYSQTVRCRTEIWATQVVPEDGRLVNRSGWYFNNLTYLPLMTRAQWADNPLGRAGSFTSGGHQWRTECDTAVTGRGGCRSYVWTDLVERDGTGHRRTQGWVFNNMVRFDNSGN